MSSHGRPAEPSPARALIACLRVHSRLLALFSISWTSTTALAEDPAPVPVRVNVVTVGTTAGAPQRLDLTAVLLGSDPAERRLFTLSPHLKIVNLPAGSWQFSGSAPGYWMKDRVVDILPNELTEITLRVWATGTVGARLSVPRQESAPARVRIGFRAAANRGSEAEAKPWPDEGNALCPVKDSYVACQLPQGMLDLRIAATGFAPVYRWSVRVTPARTSDLGALDFVPGGSVTGFVLDQLDQPRRGIRIALLAPDGQAIVQRSRDTEGQTRLRPLEVRTDARGFFQITELVPGEYRLVTKTADGTSASAVARIQGGCETRLDHAMVLAEPVAVDVVIEPPRHPTGTNWTVVFQNLDASPSDTPVQRPVPDSGAVHVDSLAEGVYLLTVQEGDQRWHGEEVEIRAPATRLEVRLPPVRVRGRLRLGGSPVAGLLVFGGRRSFESIELRSNENGDFEGYLPHAGAWPVDIQAPRPPMRRSLKRVQFEESIDGTYTADIDLPHTHLAGQVVDESFQPVTEAIVKVMPMGGDDNFFQTLVDEYGRFEAWGLPDTSVLVSATAPGPLVADPHLVAPSRGNSPTTRVQIIVRASKTLRGRIVMDGSGTPVAGAFVKVTPLAQTASFRGPLVSTDADGRFDVHLPKGTQAVDLTFGTQLHSVQMYRISALKDSEYTLWLEPTGGRLVLEFSETLDRQRFLALFHQGAAESVSFLEGLTAAWREKGHGNHEAVKNTAEVRQVTLSPLAAGDYTACFRPSGPPSIQQHTPSSPEKCATGTLRSGGELYLRVP